MNLRSSWIVLALLCVTGCSLTAAPLSTNLSTPSEPITATVAFLQDGDLWLYDQTQQRSQQILEAEEGVMQVPAFLPDGSGVLYVQQNQTYFELWRYSLAERTTEFITATSVLPTHLVIAPNSRFVLLTLEDVLFLIDLSTKTQTRIHEGVTDYAWSPSSRRLIYQTTDDNLLSRSFTVTGELEEPEIILTQPLRSPVFLSERELVFEALNADSQYTIMRYTLDTAELTAVTTLAFETAAPTVMLRLSPEQEQLVYARAAAPDETNQVFSTWLIHLQKDAPKLLVQESTVPVWSEDGSALYYGTKEQKLYRLSATGLNKTLISPTGSAITTPANQGSNTITL